LKWFGAIVELLPDGISRLTGISLIQHQADAVRCTIIINASLLAEIFASHAKCLVIEKKGGEASIMAAQACNWNVVITNAKIIFSAKFQNTKTRSTSTFHTIKTGTKGTTRAPNTVAPVVRTLQNFMAQKSIAHMLTFTRDRNVTKSCLLSLTGEGAQDATKPRPQRVSGNPTRQARNL